MDIEIIAKQFLVEGKFQEARAYGTGHLHDTFLVKMAAGREIGSYIFQRINHMVFRDPAALMENIARVTGHIRRRLGARGIGEAEIYRRVLTVILTREGGTFYRDSGGNYWRVYRFIEGARTYDVPENLDQLYQAGYMFGRFLEEVRGLPGPALHETIPGFHDGPGRFKAFEKALAADTHHRAGAVVPEVDFLYDRAELFDVVPGLVQQGKIPVRVTHNDTKINNVLLDEVTGEGLCVIDLDTVMPGVSLYDFGDLARCTLSSRGEDERDLSGVTVEMPRFGAILKGFLAGTGNMLTGAEKDNLVFSAKLMPLIIGMRFLTDYLQGDVYFKVHRPGHNLDRCRRQFKMVRAVMEHEEEMKTIVQKYLDSPSNFG